eukprot:Pgem_evm1s15208
MTTSEITKNEKKVRFASRCQDGVSFDFAARDKEKENRNNDLRKQLEDGDDEVEHIPSAQLMEGLPP